MPLLVGGALLFVIGTLMLLAASFAVSAVWGVLCLLVLPLQWLFALLNWDKAWDGLMLQVLGLGFMAAFFMQSEHGFSVAAVQQARAQFEREYGQPGSATSGTAVIESQAVQAADAEAPVIDHSNPTVEGNAELKTVTVQGEASKAVDDKPIYKCTDAQGKETFSAKPCAAFYVPPKP